MDLTLSFYHRNFVHLLGAVGVFWCALALVPCAAFADGAPPGTQAVLLPRDRPNEIVLATNFGLVFTENNGANWTYACEVHATAGGYRYILGPPALTSGGVSGDRIFGISLTAPGAPFSVDDGCTWTLSGGAIVDPLNPAVAADVFPDPSDPARVFLIAIPAQPEDAPGSIYRSLDGGLTYSGPLFTPPASTRPSLTGVEVAATSPGTVYATWYERGASTPHLTVSHDGGDSWTDVPIAAALGPLKPYLAAVDPQDPMTIYLRTGSADNATDRAEGLVISSDGGATWRQPLTIAGGSIQAFLRRANGELLVLGRGPMVNGLSPPSTLFRSIDGGKSFAGEALAFHGQGLNERNGTLYLAADNIIDLVALVSSDDGRAWRVGLRLEEIAGIKPCVQAACADSCDLLAGLKTFRPETCQASVDGGAKDAASDGNDAGSVPDAAGDGKDGGGGGCACAAAGANGGQPWLLGPSLGAVWLMRLRRRRALRKVRTAI